MVRMNHDFNVTSEDIYNAQRRMSRKSAEKEYNTEHNYNHRDMDYDLKVQLSYHKLEKIIDILGFERVELYIRNKKIDKLKNINNG